MKHWKNAAGEYIGYSPIEQPGGIEVPDAPAVPGCLHVDGVWTVTDEVVQDAHKRIDAAYSRSLALILSPDLGISCYLLGQVLQALVLRLTADPAPTADAYRGLQSLVVEGRAATLTEAADVALTDLAALMYVAGPINDARLACKAAVTATSTPAEVAAVLP